MDKLEFDIFERACQTIHELLKECDECREELTAAQVINREVEIEKFAMVESYEASLISYQSEINTLMSDRDEVRISTTLHSD